MPVLVASYASLKRIETFLLLDEKKTEDESSVSESSSEKVVLDEKSTPETSVTAINDHFAPINMNSAAFSWDPESDAFLKEISLKLYHPQLYICVGSVASVSQPRSIL